MRIYKNKETVKIVSAPNPPLFASGGCLPFASVPRPPWFYSHLLLQLFRVRF